MQISHPPATPKLPPKHPVLNHSQKNSHLIKSAEIFTGVRCFSEIPFQVVFGFSHTRLLGDGAHKLRIQQIDSAGSTERTLFFSGINCWVFHKFVIGSRTIGLTGIGCYLNREDTLLREGSWTLL
jgi:hypothetical protein